MLNFALLFILACLCLFLGYLYGREKGREEIGISKELAEHLEEFRFEHLEDVVKLLRQTKELAGMVTAVSGDVADMLDVIVRNDKKNEEEHSRRIVKSDSIGQIKVTTAEEWKEHSNG